MDMKSIRVLATSQKVLIVAVDKLIAHKPQAYLHLATHSTTKFSQIHKLLTHITTYTRTHTCICQRLYATNYLLAAHVLHVRRVCSISTHKVFNMRLKVMPQKLWQEISLLCSHSTMCCCCYSVLFSLASRCLPVPTESVKSHAHI